MVKIIEITDLSAPELAVYTKLGERELLKYDEPRPGIFIAESPKVIARALAAGYEPVSLLMETGDQREETLGVLHTAGDIPCFAAPLDVLKTLTGFPLTRGMLCAMRRKPMPDARTLISDRRRIAVLENVMNPTNVGAIIRSAAAMGIEAVLLTEGCSDPLYRRAVRVSMGTVFQIPWTVMENGADWRGILKDGGFKTCATALREDTIRIDDPALCGISRLAVVLGAEGDGLTEDTIARCDFRVKIPMAGQVDSLNVAAASAVAFWELAGRVLLR